MGAVSPRKIGWFGLVLAIVAWGIILAMIGIACAPALKDFDTLGWHDWDQMEAHRYLVIKTIRHYHQFPFWNPYGCGGHTNWGGLESGTSVISPWSLAYIFLKFGLALRAEVVGTAILSAVGTWLLAGRFTRSAGARAFVCAVFVVNGRWALQIAVGHTWHLYYAWMPWVFYFFDCAIDPKVDAAPTRGRNLVLCGATIALMVYTGAIYPLPHTAFLLGIYALLVSVRYRSARPVANIVTVGVIGFGLAAPKLVPMLETISRFPRLIASTETIDLTAFITLLTSHDQGVGARPAYVAQWGWHEYGMFIGWGAVIVLLLGAAIGRGSRETSIKWAGLLALLFGFGNFHEYSPWNLMHKMPIFKSQHGPSRWLYPAVLLFALPAAALAERLLRRAGRGRAVAELATLAFAAWVAFDVARVAALPLESAFGMELPKVAEEFTSFHTEKSIPPTMKYVVQDWAPPALPSEMANIGTIECITFPGLNVYARDPAGNAPGLGAKGKGDPAYKGEVYTLSQKGHAEVVRWTPNEVEVQVSDAAPGDLLVLNQNYYPGWTANGVDVLNHEDTVAARIDRPGERVVFRYRPRFLWLSSILFLGTVAAIVVRAKYKGRFLKPLRRWLAARSRTSAHAR